MYDVISFCKWRQGLPLPELAAKLKALGFDGVDLPCRNNAPITHADGPALLPEAARVFRDQGVRLERLVTGLLEADAETERLLETIRSIGVKKIRIGGYALTGRNAGRDPREVLAEAQRGFAALGTLLEKHGVMGAVQNHSGPTLDVNVSSCLLMLRDCDPAWVGVQYDPGHCALSGEAPDVAIGLLGPYLHSVNLKSPRQEFYVDPSTGRLAFRGIWVPLRDGMLDLPLLLRLLRAAGHTDPLSLHAEYRCHFYMVEKDAEATDALVAADVAYLRALMADGCGE